jgi:hypothetical protein
MKSLFRNPLLDSALEREVYTDQALVPACSWLNRSAPARPSSLAAATDASAKTTIRWTSGSGGQPARWLLQIRSGEKWTTHILAGNQAGLVWSGPAPPEVIALSGIDRYGGLGQSAALKLVRRPD